MTRFWITLEEALKFVIFCMKDMQGGELYIPKLKSSFIVNLAKSINDKHKILFTGIRPGEKIDETLISSDESQNVIEFKNYYLISPSIQFYETLNNYKINSLKEKGKNVQKGFSFTSKNNKDFLNLIGSRKYFKLKIE